MNERTAYDTEMIFALAALLEVAKGTACEDDVAVFVADHVRERAAAKDPVEPQIVAQLRGDG
jgi:hypothetical protein